MSMSLFMRYMKERSLLDEHLLVTNYIDTLWQALQVSTIIFIKLIFFRNSSLELCDYIKGKFCHFDSFL